MVEYRDWTTDGLIRQSTYKGLREDKAPEEITRETAGTAGVPPASSTPAPA
jgi:bifunctional non-homologous end joining protein LigD